jgi:hypothetical protein
MRVTGQYGELRVGYQAAVTLGEWEIVPVSLPGARPTFRFTARITHEHAVWSRLRPQDLVLSAGTAEWVWHGVSIERRGDEACLLLTERPTVEQRAKAHQQQGSTA